MFTFRNMFKLLDRYVLSRFLSILFGALIAFITIFLVVDVVENLDKFIDAKMPRSAVIAYYIYTLPSFISIALPMATLLATFFSMGLLNKRNEITAMKAAGLSIRRIGASLLLAGLMISAGSFLFDDLVVSESLRRKSVVQKQYLARDYRRKHKDKKQNFFNRRPPAGYIAIDRFDFRNLRAQGVYLQQFEQGRLVRRMDIQQLIWDEAAQLWRGTDYRIRSFLPGADTSIWTDYQRDTLLALGIKPVDIMKELVPPEEMRYGELKEFIEELKRSGDDPTRREVVLHFKLAFSMTSFIMVLFGLPLSVGRSRSSLAFGAGMSVFVIFGYYVAIKLGQSLGFKGILAPLPSVWLPNILFLALGFILLRRLRS